MELSISSPIIVEKGHCPNAGEDAYTVNVCSNELCYMGVFDGAGGQGSRTHFEIVDHTGAWIASRLAAAASDHYFQRNSFEFSDFSVQKLQNEISDMMHQIKSKYVPPSHVVGSLQLTFPTTLSLIAAKSINAEKIAASYIWAGDSRGYALDQKGLWQITLDDISSNADNALLNIFDDGVLTNIVNADKEFTLHHRRLEFSEPVILLSATDGCFAYFNTPMEFEAALLDTLCQSRTPQEWKNSLFQHIANVAGDDFTLTIACFGFPNFQSLKSYYQSRQRELKPYIDGVMAVNQRVNNIERELRNRNTDEKNKGIYTYKAYK
ncbi:MAG: protein phosphatase 2C domain-containing protein [Ruminococcus sp.]|nr:protein phosphatase 2C domain-containing protein [Ruminococcus sp.]